MVSLAYIFAIISVLSAAVIADEVKSGQADSVEEKWWGGRWGGYFGGGYFNYGYGATVPWFNRWGTISAYGVFPYYPSLWFKAVDGPAATRRSISIDAEHIYHRRDESTVACKNGEGQLDRLVLGDCHQAVQALVSKKSSSAHCKSCAVKLVTPQGQLATTGAPAEALQQAANKILKSCATGSSSSHARRSPDETSNSGSTKQQFAMIFQKGDGSSCDN